MSIALSISISLILGVAVMYQTQYFWGKESNSNINNMNCTMNNLTSQFGTIGTLGSILIVIVVLFLILGVCTSRCGF